MKRFMERWRLAGRPWMSRQDAGVKWKGAGRRDASATWGWPAGRQRYNGAAETAALPEEI